MVLLLVAVVVVGALAAAHVARRYDRTTITAASMEPTLRTGSSVWIDTDAAGGRGVDRGDIVVFTAPEPWTAAAQARGEEVAPGHPIAKRVIAVEGDELWCCDTGGRLVLNGAPLPEPYLAGGPSTLAFNVTVPARHLWVMGDNRAASFDSRHLRPTPGAAFVPRADVVGRIAGRR